MANSYADDINVKISEKYKPPCRISNPMSVSQRLALNKQLQDSRPTYDFTLEKSVLEKMREWKEIRKNLAEERKRMLANARQEFNRKVEEEKLKKLEKLQAEAKKTQTNLEKPGPSSSQQQEYSSSPNQQNYLTSNGILMPIPATSYSTNNNIPTTASFVPQKANTNKPFNLSDFESDTSSPFDNMELKSINDLEELAQVLKTDTNKSNYQPSNAYSNNSAMYLQNYGNHQQFSPVAYGQQNAAMYSQNPAVTHSYNQLPNSYSQVNSSSMNYSQYNNPYAPQNSYQVPTTIYSNGYLYNIVPQTTSQIQSTHSYVPYNHSLSQASCRSVPDLVKSMEKELDNTHLSDLGSESRHSVSSSYFTTNVQIPARPKSTDSVYPKPKLKNGTADMLLDKLPLEKRDVCRNVSLMGFPLDRVVRVCEIVGGDQKKIVDHLLALSELLDLGFPENVASAALLKNDNDRDKALDLLIS